MSDDKDGSWGLNQKMSNMRVSDNWSDGTTSRDRSSRDGWQTNDTKGPRPNEFARGGQGGWKRPEPRQARPPASGARGNNANVSRTSAPNWSSDRSRTQQADTWVTQSSGSWSQAASSRGRSQNSGYNKERSGRSRAQPSNRGRGASSQSRNIQPSTWESQEISQSAGGWDTSASMSDGWSNAASSQAASDGWGTSDSSTSQSQYASGWNLPASETPNNSNEGGWNTTGSQPTSTTSSGAWTRSSVATNTWDTAGQTSGSGWDNTEVTAAKSTDTWASTSQSATSNAEGWGQASDEWTSTQQNTSGGGWDDNGTQTAGDKWKETIMCSSGGWGEVKFVETVKEAPKDEDRGEWKDGVHCLAPDNEELRIKLFGTADDRESQHTGIRFDQYENIPVETKGTNVPQSMEQFTSPPIDKHLLDNIRLARYTVPTPIQKYSIPIVLSGRDLMACAQTGSGKTGGFLFPVLSSMFTHGPRKLTKEQLKGSSGSYKKAYPEALILAPTRELTMQIYKEARKFTYRSYAKPCVVYGGADISMQMRKIDRGCDVLVATPGRLVDILERRRLSLSNIRYLILDEADRMLDMGFEPQIRRIVEGEDMPGTGERQTLLFSATFPRYIQTLASDFLKDFIFLSVGRVGATSENITQSIEYVEEHEKRATLLEAFKGQENNTGLTLVFVETKRVADSVCEFLRSNRLPATAIHGDRTQPEREEALQAFRSGTCPIMVATAVAARGLDIPNVTHVISFDLPSDIDDYVHRIGRTGRAGNIGRATAFFNQNNSALAPNLVELLKEAKQDVPSWLEDLARQIAANPPPAMDGFGGRGRNRGRGAGGAGPRRPRRRDSDDDIGPRLSNVVYR